MPIDFGDLDDIGADVAALKRDLAAHPEVGPDVSRTAERIVSRLRTTSLRVREHAGFPEQSAMGIVADLKVLNAERTLALVADMSAQSIKRDQSTGGPGVRRRCAHIAGNDAHSAMLVGVALLLHRMDLRCNVRFIWQSGGELLSDGAQAMLRDGALQGVDEVFAPHVWPGLPVGQVGLAAGPIMASLDRFRLRLQGAARPRPWPHRKVDAIRIGADVVRALGDMDLQGAFEESPELLCVVTHFLAVAESETVGPDEVMIEGEIRGFSEPQREAAIRTLEQTAAQHAERWGGEARLSVRHRATVTVNDPDSVRRARARLVPILGAEALATVRPSAFASGLSGYLTSVPGSVLALGCGGETDEPALRLLSPDFAVDDPSLRFGVKALAALVAG